MEELKKLYEERKYGSLIRLCQKKEVENSREYAVYLYHACADAARSNLTRLSLEESVGLFRKAQELCGEDSKAQEMVYALFVREVLTAVDRYEEMFDKISKTSDVICNFREGMRLSADALCEAAAFADKNALLAVEGAPAPLKVKKEAVRCMVELCRVRKYEVDMGKAMRRMTDNAPEEIRVKYGSIYDALREEIRKEDPDYAPEEIQREKVQAEVNACQLKLPREGEPESGNAAEEHRMTEKKEETSEEMKTAQESFLGKLKKLF